MDGKTRKELRKEERERLKGLSFKKKLEYIWDYYKMELGILLVVLVIIGLSVQVMKGSGKTTVLSAALINVEKVSGGETLEFSREFSDDLELDEKKEDISFDDSYVMNMQSDDIMTTACQTKLIAAIQAETLDVMLMPEDVYQHYLKAGAYLNLEEVLGKDFLNQYPELVCTGREEGGREDHVYGLKFEENEKLEALYGKRTVYFAVASGSKNGEYVKRLAEYLMEGNAASGDGK